MDPTWTDPSDATTSVEEILSSSPSPSGVGGGDDAPISAMAAEHQTPIPPLPPDWKTHGRKRSRYDEQKRRDWSTFQRFLEKRKPRLTLSRVRSPHVIEFLHSIDSFGKTLVHEAGCPFYGRPQPPSPPCSCPLRQSWGSLDALVGRLRAACDESPVRPDTNPFGVRAVRNYLLHIKDTQATARGIPYSRKRRNQSQMLPDAPSSTSDDVTATLPSSSHSAAATAGASTSEAADGRSAEETPGGSSAAVSSPVAIDSATSATTVATALMAAVSPLVMVEGSGASPRGGSGGAAAFASDSSEAGAASVVSVTGAVGQTVAYPMQICWVRPPVVDNQAPPPFFPIWRCTTIESLVPFLPRFPYVPVPSPQRGMENDRRVKRESLSQEDDQCAELLIAGEGPSSSHENTGADPAQAAAEDSTPPSQHKNRYEEQKRRDWNTFLRFLENREPRLTLSRARSPHVIEFLKSIDQFGKTLVHESSCPYFGNANPPAPCGCPLRQSWGSLDALVGRLRAACEESPNCPDTNPFGVRAVRNYLLHVKDSQATARGIPYSRKRKQYSTDAAMEPSQAPLNGGGKAGLTESVVDVATALPPSCMNGEVGGRQPESAVAAAIGMIANANMGEEEVFDCGTEDLSDTVFSSPLITSVAAEGSCNPPCASSQS